jgi:hypothetical protein
VSDGSQVDCIGGKHQPSRLDSPARDSPGRAFAATWLAPPWRQLFASQGDPLAGGQSQGFYDSIPAATPDTRYKQFLVKPASTTDFKTNVMA